MLEKFFAGLAFTLATLAIVAVCVVGYYIWPEKDSTMPAWIQAVGSVGAILVAVVVMDTQHRRVQRDKVYIELGERLNLLTSTMLLGGESSELAKKMLRNVVDGTIDRGESKVIEIHLKAALQGFAAIPIWRADLDEIGDITTIAASCRALIATIEATDISDQQRYARMGGVGNPPRFPVGELADVLGEFVEVVDRKQEVISGHYRRLRDLRDKNR